MMFGFPSQLVLLCTAVLLAAIPTSHALPVSSVVHGGGLEPRGNTPSRFTHCPSVNDIMSHIWSQSGGSIQNPVFWSYPGSVTQAQHLARSLNGHYIYDYVSNENIAAWGALCSPNERNVLWKRASYAFAKLGVGAAYVVTNTAYNRDDAVWNVYELPVLQATGNIQLVFVVDPMVPHKPKGTLWTRKLHIRMPFPAEP